MGSSWRDLSRPGATLASGVSAGFVSGVLIGGVGGRLAMLLLRVTSDPSLHGLQTDDGFRIGRVSAETLFLLGVTAGLGMAGGHLLSRRATLDHRTLARAPDDRVLRSDRWRRRDPPERG